MTPFCRGTVYCLFTFIALVRWYIDRAERQAVAQRLVQLYKAAREGPVFCRTQRFNIQILLESIQRLYLHEAPDNDSVLPLLIATTNTATWLLNLLEPRGSFYNRWLWVSKGPEIESAFRALNDKTRLLQLHITERTYNIVAHVRKDIKNMGPYINDSPSKTSQSLQTSDSSNVSELSDDPTVAPGETPPSSAIDKKEQVHTKITANNNTAAKETQQSIANGWGCKLGSAEINASGNEGGERAQHAVANAGEPKMAPISPKKEHQ
ncbi:MAG: hypothetical protein Q9225_006668 [Loekoesia sp. 1 TL-2023]